MQAFLTSPWIISIIGGIIVWLITHFIFSKQENKEHLNKILAANKEVLDAVRSSISEGCLPTREIIKSLISSTSRKYCIEEKDMFSLEQIADDLIKEVMDSDFISAKIKTKFCNHLSQLKIIPQPTSLLFEQIEGIYERNAYTFRRRTLNTMSIVMGIFTTLIVVFSTLPYFRSIMMFPFEIKNPSLVLLIATFIAVILSYFVWISLKFFKRKEREKRYKLLKEIEKIEEIKRSDSQEHKSIIKE